MYGGVALKYLIIFLFLFWLMQKFYAFTEELVPISKKLMIFDYLIGDRKYLMKDQCVIWCGVILRI